MLKAKTSKLVFLRLSLQEIKFLSKSVPLGCLHSFLVFAVIKWILVKRCFFHQIDSNHFSVCVTVKFAERFMPLYLFHKYTHAPRHTHYHTHTHTHPHTHAHAILLLFILGKKYQRVNVSRNVSMHNASTDDQVEISYKHDIKGWYSTF